MRIKNKMVEFKNKNRAEKLNVEIKYSKKEEIYLIIDKKYNDEVIAEIDYTMFNENIFKKNYYLRVVNYTCLSQKDLKHIQKKLDLLNKK